MISMRSIRSGEMSESSASPKVGLATRTPSISTWTLVGSTPRIEMLVVVPRLPDCRTSRPGTDRSASWTVT